MNRTNKTILIIATLFLSLPLLAITQVKSNRYQSAFRTKPIPKNVSYQLSRNIQTLL